MLILLYYTLSGSNVRGWEEGREEGRGGRKATEGNAGSAHEESCCFTIDVRGRMRGGENVGDEVCRG